jgi:hypothetical protein
LNRSSLCLATLVNVVGGVVAMVALVDIRKSPCSL